jgi:cytosine/adenosine deaminase-related metal-dependent hydrolase
MAVSLQARVVFPVDRPPFERGVVTMEGERIVAVGQVVPPTNCLDLGDVALLPGLVNAHTHLEFSHLRKPLGKRGMSLVDWIRLVIAERGGRGFAAGLAIEDGIHESLTHGVTSIGDITTVEVPAHFFPRIDLTLFHEAIGFSRARAASALAAILVRLLPQFMPDSYAGRATADIHFGISPHSPYTVSPVLITKLIELARQRDVPVAMHLAESREELEFLQSGTGPFQELLEERSMWDVDAVPRGSRPMDYLRMLSEAPRALVIHGNFLEADELEFLGNFRGQMSLVYCPRTHDYFSHAPYPLGRALAAGARVALGTDSRASNPDLDLLAELRSVARSHLAVRTQDILRMGTLSGAEALGRDADVGSITPGKLGNLVAIPLPADAHGAGDELLSGLLATDEAPSGVWLRGRRVGQLDN